MKQFGSTGKYPVIAYLARAMTGVKKDVLVATATSQVAELQSHGIDCLDPVLGEGVVPTNEPLAPLSDAALRDLFGDDKAAIRKAHVVIDLSGTIKSEGAIHEIGYARYFLWKPVIRVLPGLGVSVARIEDDAVVGSLEEAAQIIHERWGSWLKRLTWRARIIFRSLPKFFLYQLQEFLH